MVVLIALKTVLLNLEMSMRGCLWEPILLQFIADILWILLLVILRLLVMRFLILILMEFLLILVTIILRLLVTMFIALNLTVFLLVLVLTILRLLIALLLGFVWIVKGCLREPPYTTAPPYNAWGNAPVDDS